MSKRTYGLQSPPSLGVPGKKRYAMVIDLRRCIGCGACVVADDPPCVRNCPTQATYKHESGFILQRYNRCIGCKTCMVACPYNARHLLPAARTDHSQPTDVADKCDFCIHRVTRGLMPTCVTTCMGGAITFGDVNDSESEVSRMLDTHKTMTLRSDKGTRPQVYYIGLDGDIADVAASYADRSVQMREEFNIFKRNRLGAGNIIEGESETGPVGFPLQVIRNMINFVKDIVEKGYR
ncbi:MAG: 4Fe-4S dicluster domain-containing protein [Deltaproteobacteria bacterium]|nr:4Fe-4S dicluster domain-containing protein [Deltaproteobacteria bacterium]